MPLLDLYQTKSPTWSKLPKEPKENTEKEEANVVGYSQEGFELNIIECVGKGLSRFGAGVPRIVMGSLRWTDHIRNEEIPNKPDEFERGLDKIFRSGSASVKKAITDEIKCRFGLTQDYPTMKEFFAAAAKSPMQSMP